MNKDLLIRVFSNKLLFNRIFQNVRSISRHFLNNLSFIEEDYQLYKYDQIINKPDILATYGYLPLLENYYNNLFRKNNKNNRNSKRNSNKLDLEDIKLATMVIENSIEFNHLDILRYMLEDIMNYDTISEVSYASFIVFAVSIGSMEIIRFLIDFDSNSSDDNKKIAFVHSPYSGNFEIIKFLKVELGPKDLSNMICHAISVGNIEILKWIIKEFNFEITSKFVYDNWSLAFQSNNLEMIEYLFNHIDVTSFIFKKQQFNEAVRCCDINIFEWLFSKNVNISLVETIRIVLDNISIKRNRISIIQLIYNHFQSQSPSSVIDNSNDNNNSSINSGNTVSNAMTWFYNNILKYIHIYGKTILEHTVYNSNFDIADWILENTSERDKSFKTLDTKQIITKFNYDAFKWIIKNGFYSSEWEIVDCLLDHNRINLLYWFFENRIDGNEIHTSVESIMKAIDTNDLELINSIHHNTIIDYTSNEIYSAFKNGDSNIIKWLHTNQTERYQKSFHSDEFKLFNSETRSFIALNYPGESLPEDVINQVKDDHLAFKHICINHQQFIKDDTIIIASKFGELELVKEMHNKLKYKQLDTNTMTNIYKQSLYYAGLNNHFNIIQFIIENTTLPNSTSTKSNHPMEGVCIGGSIDCFKLLNNTVYKCTLKCPDIAASNGHINLVICMNEHGYKCSKKGFNQAVGDGHHLVAKYFMESDKEYYKPKIGSMIAASGRGHLEMIKLLTENGFKFKEEVFDRAALGGHTDLVRYLLDKGYKGTVKSKHNYNSNITSIIDEYHKSNSPIIDSKKRLNQDDNENNENSKPLKKTKK